MRVSPWLWVFGFGELPAADAFLRAVKCLLPSCPASPSGHLSIRRSDLRPRTPARSKSTAGEKLVQFHHHCLGAGNDVEFANLVQLFEKVNIELVNVFIHSLPLSPLSGAPTKKLPTASKLKLPVRRRCSSVRPSLPRADFGARSARGSPHGHSHA